MMTRSKELFYVGQLSNVLSLLLSLIVLSSLLMSNHESLAAPVRTYEQQLEQVRLYINNDMFEAAKRELERLKSIKRGQNDERVHIALAKTNYKLFNVTQALSNLRKARTLVDDQQSKQKLTELYEQWLSIYGLVRFESVDPLQTGTIELVRQRKFINRDRQSALEKVQKLLQERVELPVSVYLPYGAYSANGVNFKIQRNRPTPIVEVMLTPLIAQKPTPSKSNLSQWLYVGLGSIALISAGVGGYYLLQDSPPSNRQLTITISDGR